MGEDIASAEGSGGHSLENAGDELSPSGLPSAPVKPAGQPSMVPPLTVDNLFQRIENLDDKGHWLIERLQDKRDYEAVRREIVTDIGLGKLSRFGFTEDDATNGSVDDWLERVADEINFAREVSPVELPKVFYEFIRTFFDNTSTDQRSEDISEEDEDK